MSRLKQYPPARMLAEDRRLLARLQALLEPLRKAPGRHDRIVAGVAERAAWRHLRDARRCLEEACREHARAARLAGRTWRGPDETDGRGVP